MGAPAAQIGGAGAVATLVEKYAVLRGRSKRGLAKALGIDSFARHLIERGVPDRDVAQLMGHVSLRAMWGYTVPDEAALRRAVELLP